MIGYGIRNAQLIECLIDSDDVKADTFDTDHVDQIPALGFSQPIAAGTRPRRSISVMLLVDCVKESRDHG